MDGRVVLKDFLHTFDRYFAKKYDGDGYDQTQELAKCLLESLLEVFKSTGDAR